MSTRWQRGGKRPTDPRLRVFQNIDMSGGPHACWPWKLKLNDKGLPYQSVNGKKRLAYRLTYELVHGTVPDDLVLRHSCDNPVCCNPYHLTPGTHQENMNDMKERERHGLPHHTVRAIRKLGAEKVTHKEIAERYGIARTTVTDIINRRYYQHVE